MGAKNSSNKKTTQNPVNEINWENEALKIWRDAAEEKQIFYCLNLGNTTWEKYKADEESFLKLKIGLSLFGPQTIKKEQKDLSKYFNETHQKTQINKIINILKKECKSEYISIGFIFVIACVNEKYEEFPVIRMLKEEKKGTEVSYFIDSFGKLYKSWPEFLQKNAFPYCIYCYPTNGFYSWTERGEILLEFGHSPNSKLKNQTAKTKSNTAPKVASIENTSVTSLAKPVAGPVVMAAPTGTTIGVWSTLKTLVSVVDVALDIHSKISTHKGSQCNPSGSNVFGGMLKGANKSGKSGGSSKVSQSLSLFEDRESFVRDIFQIYKIASEMKSIFTSGGSI